MRAYLVLITIIICNAVYGQNNSGTDSIAGTFGIACGVVGSPPPTIMKTISLVNQLDTTQLIGWVESLNVQNKIHGVVGLYFLKKNGVILSTFYEDKIKDVRKSESLVDICEGCIYGRKKSLKYLLTKKNLNNYYDWYIASGFRNLD